MLNGTHTLRARQLVEAVAKEQESVRGNFPGPVPVIADVQLRDLTDCPEELCQGAKLLGAAAMGIRYYMGDYPEISVLEESLKNAVAAAEQKGMPVILLGEFGADGSEGVAGAAELGMSVGAAASLTKSYEDNGVPALGC